MTWTNPPDNFPSNSVLPFLGPVSAVPEGWVVCDGTLGTQDIRERYVRGVASNVTLPGSTGGQNSYTISSSQIASHSHNGNTGSAGEHRHQFHENRWYTGWCCSNGTGYMGGPLGASDPAGSHSHSNLNLGNSGGSSSVDSNPAYVETLYIQKL